MNITIDNGVPIPKRKGRRARVEWTKWPFASMQVNDSFFAGISVGVRSSSQDYEAAHPGVKFLTRWFDEKHPDTVTKLPGIRVWRIE